MNPGVTPWSPQQRRWLQALGHSVLRLGAGEDEPAATAGPGRIDAADQVVATPPAPSPQRLPAQPALDPAPPRRAPAAPADTAAGETAPAPTARAAMRRPARLPDRLQLAMLRASGLDPADPAAQALMAQWPVERLRGDGAAKRAFWPQLRALRRRP
ncbi:hypothetical protein [Pseudoxanthomonas suwonensis]|uniref:Alanine acetyltransferase n=1 Tax=Pseudoxanthomonas suwonensis TaxID=314722 RepID=A0A0E3UNK1_9GAMM|nr:hypothetical protein [Pseudoxanthomonas suwonensis]AKC87246.1 hypothetical protein WQ53_11300 [Pseudoxanthomonas suwonensis]